MEELKAYKIGFTGLANGSHAFSFGIGGDFFACFAHSEIQQGDVHLDLRLEKEENMLVFDFSFRGWVEVACDRCLDHYREHVDFERQMYFKFGDAHTEQTEDIILIPHTESQVDVSHYVYEFMHLALPFRRVHPDEPQGRSGCDPDMLARMRAHAADESGQGTEPLADSSLEALKSLRFRKNN